MDYFWVCRIRYLSAGDGAGCPVCGGPPHRGEEPEGSA